MSNKPPTRHLVDYHITPETTRCGRRVVDSNVLTILCACSICITYYRAVLCETCLLLSFSYGEL